MSGPQEEQSGGAATTQVEQGVPAGGGSSGHDNNPRVQLACFYCRAKRIRCSGTKPVCTACSKAGAQCEWPAGRRRKRTRREMEEARRAEAAAASGSAAGYPIPNFAGSSGSGSITSASGSATGYPAASYPAAGYPIPSLTTSAPMGGTHADFPAEVPFYDVWEGGGSSFMWPDNFLPQGFSFDMVPDLDTIVPGLAAPGSGSAGPAAATDPRSLGPLEGFLKDDHSPGTDVRLFDALDQTAYLKGNLDDDEVELYYYRFSGTTALNPGINRISLKLHRREEDGGVARAPEPKANSGPPKAASGTGTKPPLWDENGLPFKHVWDPIFERFLQNMSQHFPSLSRRRMEERYESGTMSAFLANCVLALGARFGAPLPSSDEDGVAACAPFVAKAQELVIPLLHLPAYDVCTGLLMLAWASYGQNSDSGLWQYSGMAMRMAIDLGVHENSEMYEDHAHLVRTRLLFWTLFITDRIIAFATGRPVSIPEDIIEIPLPEDADFFPDPARNTAVFPAEMIQPVPFVYLTRLMIICGRISNILNGRHGRPRTLVAADEPEGLLAQQLDELQAHLVKFYAMLPDSMRWSPENFKYQHNRGHGGTYLALHVWANAVLALVYHPDLLRGEEGVGINMNAGMPPNVELALASARQIGECMVYADLVTHVSYTSTPIVVQPCYVAAMALIHEMRTTHAQTPGGHESHAADLMHLSMARQSFTALLRAISRIEAYWAGASYVLGLLEKRSGIAAPARAKETFISLPDQGLLRRFKIDVRGDPRNVAPATETSLRESVFRSQSASAGASAAPASNISSTPSPSDWVGDLISGFDVENMSYKPADQVDFARLMAAAGHSPRGQGGQ